MSSPPIYTSNSKACYFLPFAKNPNFVGRKDELETLSQRLLTNHGSEVAIIGIGGMGKTQLALQFSYMVKEQRPTVSIFWVPAASIKSFEQACADIVAALHIDNVGMSEEDAKVIVREHLSSEEAGQWLVVLDDLSPHQKELLDYIPQSKKGMTLITSRWPGNLRSPIQENLLGLGQMTLEESAELFHKSVIRRELARDDETRLLHKLAGWPLAIPQAAAYLNMNKISIARYLQLMEDVEKGPLRHEVESCFDYLWLGDPNSKITTTLMVSFVHLGKSNADAAALLAFMSCIDFRAISRSLIPSMKSEEATEDAINTLCSYSLLARRGDERPAETSKEEWYDMHPVVHSAASTWTREFESGVDMVQQAQNFLSDKKNRWWLEKLYPGRRDTCEEDGDRQPVSIATTPATDTVSYTLAGTTLIETDSSATPIHMHSLKFPESKERDEDCNSVVSNNEDIGSQIGTEMRTHAELHAVKVLGNFFGESTELRSLHDKLFERLGRERFVNNYRRVLKYHVLRLEGQSEARNHIEKATIRILKSRANRNSIARKIIEMLDSGDEVGQKQFDPLDCQPKAEEELARWMDGLPAVNMHDIGSEEGFEAIDNYSDHGEDSDEDYEDGGKTEKPLDPQHDFGTNFSSVIDSAKEFLHRHIGILSLELRLLLLPASLREVVETVPREDIHISRVKDVTLGNMIKAFVEDNTAIEWDWWPLKSRVPDLPPDQQRLEWQISGHFFYQALSSTEADEVKSVLGQIGNHPPKCYCCAAKASQQNTSQFVKDLSTSLTTCMIDKIQNYWPISSSTSTARLRYTPSNTPATGTSPASANNTPGATSSQLSNVTGNVAQAQSNSANSSPTNLSQVSAWVIFGIEDGSGFNDIENIDTSCPLMHDARFFTELKQLESKHRWPLLRWLSPYIFSYCKFVQFDTMNIDRVYCCGEHLPEDHHREAQYHPRPRVAERPPIGKQEFMRYLRTCGRYCLWSRLPFFRHRCCRPHETSHKWQRIPRKLSPFDTKVALPENVAYGLDAVYVLSFPMVFIYHTLSILAWFGFWVWWLKLHPGDLQNASVPMMVFLGIVASFWVLPGRQRDG